MSGFKVEVEERTSGGAKARFAAGSEVDIEEEAEEVIMKEITSLMRTDLPAARARRATWT